MKYLPQRDPRDPIVPDFKYVSEKKGAPGPSEDYHPGFIMGRCSECGVTGIVDFPKSSFSWNKGDRIMSYQSVKAYCQPPEGCGRMVDFIPVDENKLTEGEKKDFAILINNANRVRDIGRRGGQTRTRMVRAVDVEEM